MHNDDRTLELIPLWNMKPSRWQPRDAKLDEDSLIELAHSIRDNGLINPVLVFSYDDADGCVVWELIAGERRTRAAIAIALAAAFPNHSLDEWARRLANVGLTGLDDAERQALHHANATIAATLDAGDDMQHRHLLAVIENLDRDGLSPIEEGRAYAGLQAEYGWSQRDLAARVNKSQGYVAQRIALLTLPAATQEAVNTRVLSLTHARAIAGVPEPFQAAVTAWAVGAVQSNDAPATSRQVENRVRQIAAFVDPARWDPNGETVYWPQTRNRLALIRQIVENLVLTEARAQAIMELADNGWNHINLLNLSPSKVVDSAGYMFDILAALTGVVTPAQGWLAVSKSCSSCVWGPAYNRISDDAFSELPCDNVGRDKPLTVCEKHIGVGDPVIIPLYDWNLRVGLRDQDEIHAIEEPFLHLTSVDDFIEIYKQAVALKQKRAHEDAQSRSRRHVEQIRVYYEWQQALPLEWRAHFQAHACEKCTYYAPLLLEQDDPPCRLVVDPLRRREYQQDHVVAPDFGCLVAKSGQLAPRCEAFSYRDTPAIHLAGHPERILPARSRVLAWIEAIVARAKATYSNHVLWGAFSWLNYGRTIGHSEVDWKPLSRWLAAHWDDLGDAAIAHLVDVAISETEMFTHTDRHAVELLDATGIWREIWRRISFPFDDIRKNSYNFPANWPEDWPKPWEEEAETDE